MTYLKERLQKLKEAQSEQVDLSGKSITIVTAGDDPASEVYVRQKVNVLTGFGATVNHIQMAIPTTQEELDAVVRNCNDTGILVQLPLPDGLVCPSIPDHQDVDGFNLTSKVLPCTAQACLDIMHSEVGSIEGLNVLVLGRSNIVGFPLAVECIKQGATVTVGNSKSKWFRYEDFDIVVVATGARAHYATEFIDVPLVIDVGIHRIEGKVVGDVIGSTGYSNITPVPGGVGPFTVLNVARNLVKL
ncbi:tetrahydrofolate dehydrogenase and cyclohydrolase [Vibrio phage D479]